MTIEDRIEKIEKENQALKDQARCLKKWMAGIGTIALAGFVGGTALSVRAYTAAIDPASITTQTIILKDTSGRQRLVLHGGNGSVSVLDANGKARVQLSSFGSVSVADDAGAMRAVMGSPGLVRVFDANGKSRASLTSDGNFSVRDSNATLRVALSAADNKIYFRNASGQNVAQYPQ